MLKRTYDGQKACSVAQALEIIGERWTWLIIRDAFLGVSKFVEFEESLGIARNVLTDRLNRLVEEGIFERVLYQEGPARYEYRLTQKGSDLFTALNALRQWGDQYLSAKPMRLLRRQARQDTCHRSTRSRRSARSRRTRDRARTGARLPAPRPRHVIPHLCATSERLRSGARDARFGRAGAEGDTPASRQRSCPGAPVRASARCWDGRIGAVTRRERRERAGCSFPTDAGVRPVRRSRSLGTTPGACIELAQTSASPGRSRSLSGGSSRERASSASPSGASRRRGGPGIAHTRTSALSPVSYPPAPGARRHSIADSGRCDEPRP